MTKRKNTISPPRRFSVDLTLDVAKSGTLRKLVPAWVAETLLAQAKREGWGHLLTVHAKVRG